MNDFQLRMTLRCKMIVSATRQFYQRRFDRNEVTNANLVKVIGKPAECADRRGLLYGVTPADLDDAVFAGLVLP